MLYSESFVINALAPFNFDLTAQIYRNGDPQIRIYRDGVLSLVAKLNDQLVLMKISSKGSVASPRIGVELKSNKPITLQDSQRAQETTKFILNLDFDLGSFYEQINKDPVMREIARQLCGLKNPTTPTVFESLVDSVVEQQISIKVAIALEEKFIKKLGDHLEIEGETYFVFPMPKTVATATVDDIVHIGLTRRKAEYIYGVAQLIATGKLDLEELKTRESADEIIAVLDTIRGIGVWTAELTMLRGMHRLDMLPADDLGIRRVISTYYCKGRPIKAAEGREIAKRWGRWKGLAAFYLIIAEIRGLIV